MEIEERKKRKKRFYRALIIAVFTCIRMVDALSRLHAAMKHEVMAEISEAFDRKGNGSGR